MILFGELQDISTADIRRLISLLEEEVSRRVPDLEHKVKAQIYGLMRSKLMIDAIKLLKEHCPEMSLYDSKMAVERIEKEFDSMLSGGYESEED